MKASLPTQDEKKCGDCGHCYDKFLAGCADCMRHKPTPKPITSPDTIRAQRNKAIDAIDRYFEQYIFFHSASLDDYAFACNAQLLRGLEDTAKVEYQTWQQLQELAAPWYNDFDSPRWNECEDAQWAWGDVLVLDTPTECSITSCNATDGLELRLCSLRSDVMDWYCPSCREEFSSFMKTDKYALQPTNWRYGNDVGAWVAGRDDDFDFSHWYE